MRRWRRPDRCSLVGCKGYPDVVTYGRRRRWWPGRRRVLICRRHARLLAGLGRAMSSAETIVVKVDDLPRKARYRGAHRAPAWTS